jgi:alkylation response protein AidB-like acyl-CoA dehydrogenase
MDFDFTPAENAFRAEVRAFLDANLPDPVPESPEFLDTWNRKLRERGWVGFNWPPEHGGAGGGLIEQFILKEEMAARRAPPLGRDFMGLTWVGPALIRHGSEEQKRRHLPGILDGTSVWCTGYSEPGTGSDLAGLQTRAERDGDHYVVTGQKIWTSLADQAGWIFMLVRTRADDGSRGARYGGITCLLVDMRSPGITVQPIPNLSGRSSFCQTFFDGVRVPVENRLGAEGQGWQVVVGALANERSGISEATGMRQHWQDLVELARTSERDGKPALEQPDVRQKLAAFDARIEAMRLNGMRHLTRQLQGDAPSSETSINKIQRGVLEIAMAELALELQGHASQARGRWQNGSLSFHGTVIGGGAPNIQRNIIAERILGLPKD